jgi:hypothetical protein
MSEVYLDQLTFCKVKLLLCHPAYHAVATIGPGVIFVGQVGEAAAVAEGRLALDEAAGRRLAEACAGGLALREAATNLQVWAAHASWAVVTI